MDPQRAAFVALALTPGISARRLDILLAACDSPIGAHTAPFAFLSALPGFSRAGATAVREARLDEGDRILREVAALGGTCLLPIDDGWPAPLRDIPDPPAVLFLQGDPCLLTLPAVAIVGSRDHTAYGAAVCRTISAAAAGAGLVVVSGMARGLDAVAHAAALDAGGSTLGVLGNGLGVVYPAANRQLYDRVREHGLLLTEFPPGERPRVSSFPRRNRLISGLARATVVVEAAAGSGALLTVESALAQGREVLAVPGPITSPTSVGTNRLIRDGAGPLLEPLDLLQHYPELGGPAGASAAPPGAAPGGAAPDLSGLSPEERRILDTLTPAPRHIDDLATGLGLPVHEVLPLLSGLEIAGLVGQLPGWMFRRAG